MVYEAGRHLAVATSTNGTSWVPGGAILNETPPTDYGLVSQRAPSVAIVQAEDLSIQYHLWFEGESENDGFDAGEPPRNAIVHAVSLDGETWVEDPDEASIAFTGSDSHPWRAEVGEPSVVVMDDGSLTMFFVGRNPQTGSTAIGRATSSNGKDWLVDDDPLSFSGPPQHFERDGVGTPAALQWGNVIHLFYTGYSGSRASIGYAVGAETNGSQMSWERYGQVFEASRQWEAQQVLSPSVIAFPTDDPNVAELRMWYQGGVPGLGHIGLASRELPAFEIAQPLVSW
jgi:hypothetical protein